MTKANKLYESLKTRALGGVPGQPFASFRTIMRDYSVSQATVAKATSRLVAEGLLKKNTGREMEITDEILNFRHGAAPVICLALPHWQSDWYARIEHHFFDMADQLNYELEVLRYDWRLKVPHEFPKTRIDAMVVVTDGQMFTSEQLRCLEEQKIPFVIFGGNLSCFAVHCVHADDEYAGAKAAHHLVSLGHRSLAVLVSEPKSEEMHNRIKGFRQFCELNSIDSEIIDCGIVHGDFVPEKVYLTLKKHFSESAPGFTGLFTLSECSSFGIYRACNETGIRLPQDLSVISIGEFWQAAYMNPPLTTIGSDVSNMVRETIAILTGPEANGPNFIHRMLRPVLIRRSSTAPCRTGKISFNHQ